MKDGLRFVDCDMHIMEPPDLFEKYLDPKFKDRVILPIGADGRPRRGMIVIDGLPTSMDTELQQYRKRKTPQDFLEEARRDIPEVSVEEVEARRTRGDDLVLLDVREKDEGRAGYIEGAVTIPRGFLEFQVAGQLPQTDKDIVVYCAGGVRSLLAAKVLRSMGYEHVTSMTGGITRWRDAGYPMVRDQQLSAEQLERYSHHSHEVP